MSVKTESILAERPVHVDAEFVSRSKTDSFPAFLFLDFQVHELTRHMDVHAM